MLLAEFLPWCKKTHEVGSDGGTPMAGILEGHGGMIRFEMNLHVPCQVTGVTKNSSIWQGKTTTLSLSSFGARLLLPAEAELEGDILLSFKIPSPLMILFPKRRFCVEAEVMPSGAAGPGMASWEQRVVSIVFSEPLYFNVGSVKSGTYRREHVRV